MVFCFIYIPKTFKCNYISVDLADPMTLFTLGKAKEKQRIQFQYKSNYFEL